MINNFICTMIRNILMRWAIYVGWISSSPALLSFRTPVTIFNRNGNRFATPSTFCFEMVRFIIDPPTLFSRTGIIYPRLWLTFHSQVTSRNWRSKYLQMKRVTMQRIDFLCYRVQAFAHKLSVKSFSTSNKIITTWQWWYIDQIRIRLYGHLKKSDHALNVSLSER